MNAHLERINQRIEPLKKQITQHKLYSSISTIDDLKILMKFHVFAVWDFMSLLKALQNNLTCTTVPWFPKGSADTRYLINEIVVGEESDVDNVGNRKSHFELYLDAMDQCKADTSQVKKFVSEFSGGNTLIHSLQTVAAPDAVSNFVRFTFDTIYSNKVHLQSAIFTFGREDLIPCMFLSLIKDLDSKFPNNISVFKYYLERHIEVDGDHHSHLAMQMTETLCGENEQYWKEAEEAICESLQKRIELWDGACSCIEEAKLLRSLVVSDT